MDPHFRKDLSHLTWDEIYARQMQRAALVPDWIEALRLKGGDRVLDVGAGPGYVSFSLSEHVGPDGLVYAIDRSDEALAYLEQIRKRRGISNVKAWLADAVTLRHTALNADSALISMVLHHTDDPQGLLSNIRQLLAPHAVAVVAEFHPHGPCQQGAPQSARLAPEHVQAWCEEAGFSVSSYRRQSPEHYMLLAERAS